MRFEVTLESAKTYKNPLQDVQVTVDVTPPSGRTYSVDAFWDGERSFRARIAPDEPGPWRYRTRASDVTNAGLHEKSGGFTCGPAKGTNPLYTHGHLRVSDDRSHLIHADGTPFFWLADTVWAGPMLSSEKDWQTFLRDRRAKRFNVAQVMGTQNIAAAANASGRQAFFLDGDKVGIEPAFWRWLDRRFDALNQEGMVVSPSFSWAARWAPAGRSLDPGVFQNAS